MPTQKASMPNKMKKEEKSFDSDEDEMEIKNNMMEKNDYL